MLALSVVERDSLPVQGHRAAHRCYAASTARSASGEMRAAPTKVSTKRGVVAGVNADALTAQRMDEAPIAERQADVRRAAGPPAG